MGSSSPNIGQIGVKIPNIFELPPPSITCTAPTPAFDGFHLRKNPPKVFLLDSALSRTCCLPRCVFLLLPGKVSSSWWNWLLLDWWFIYIWGWEKMTKLQTCCLWWSAVCQKEKTLSGLKATFFELFVIFFEQNIDQVDRRHRQRNSKWKIPKSKSQSWQHISLHHWVKWLFGGSCANMANKCATTARNSYKW